MLKIHSENKALSGVSSEDRVKTAMAKILKLFESDNLEIMARAVFKYPEGSTYSKPSDNWSFINRMLMMIENTEDARGFRQWKSAGRNVLKGSKAFYIFAPKMAKVEDKKTGEEQTILTGFMSPRSAPGISKTHIVAYITSMMR